MAQPDALRDALRPFAAFAHNLGSDTPDDWLVSFGRFPNQNIIKITVGDFRYAALVLSLSTGDPPIPMLLTCPGTDPANPKRVCGARHIDEPLFDVRPHHTHACQRCGHVWRPAIIATVGVQFLPGFKNEETHD